MTTAPADTTATTTPGPGTRPGPKMKTDWITRTILGLVMAAALSVGTWSVFTLLSELFHAPKLVAAFGCVMFDGAAFFFARLSQRYATTTDSGLAPRAAMLAMICTSSWVNWQHAALKHWGTVGGVVLAAAPIIAELAFEMWHRYEHREALRALGRVAETLPVLGKWAWLTHPKRSRKVIDAHIRAGLAETEALAERRRELAVERARSIVSVPTQALTATPTRDAQASALTSPSGAQPKALTASDARAQEAVALTKPTERPALTVDAHPLTPSKALAARTERPTVSTPIERAHTTKTERTTAERPSVGAQSAPSLTERKALKEQQDALTLTLYTTLSGRPEWTEIRDALVSAGLESVSRPTAQRIRERVESAHPELPRERRQALAGSN